MNFLTTPEVRKELGSDTNAGRMGHSHALILQSWLGYDADMACWERERSSRYAGSVITRADAELFGLSFPRFAIRVYLDDQQTSFMNLRRTNLLASRAEILMTHLSNGEEKIFFGVKEPEIECDGKTKHGLNLYMGNTGRRTNTYHSRKEKVDKLIDGGYIFVRVMSWGKRLKIYWLPTRLLVSTFGELCYSRDGISIKRLNKAFNLNIPVSG